jgi:hypothetical protein
MTTNIFGGTLESEIKFVKAGMGQALREGEKWHLIDSEWFNKWKLYVDFDNQFRGSRLQEVIMILLIIKNNIDHKNK